MKNDQSYADEYYIFASCILDMSSVFAYFSMHMYYAAVQIHSNKALKS